MAEGPPRPGRADFELALARYLRALETSVTSAVAPPSVAPAGGSSRRWWGEGPPDVVVGASPGDEYVDRLTLDLYVLQ